MKPLAIDLFCGLGGWTEGLIAEGYTVIGFDNEQHVYGEARYPGQLVIQDVLTLHGSQFKDAALIVASPPCQAYSYRAMPWKRAKALPPPDNTLFEACFRIQREAIEAAGHFIPLVVENVCGAQKWVGRARWHFGSFYLWGDVPALMPITRKARKVAGFRFDGSGGSFQTASVEASGVKVATMGAGWYPPDHPKHVRGLAFNGHADRNLREGQKMVGESTTRTQKGRSAALANYDRLRDDIKQGGDTSSRSVARKAASAHIAKIPYELARHIGRAWYPAEDSLSGVRLA